VKICKTWFLSLCGIAWLAAGSAGASEVIYDGTGFIRGQQSGMESFSVSGPGTLTVALTNVAWPEQLGSLNMVVRTAGGVLGPEMSAGTESFALTGGEVFAQWFGAAQGPLDVGVYGLKIEFQPSGVLPVPLPTSVVLLASGLALLIWQRRHRREFRPANEPTG